MAPRRTWRTHKLTGGRHPTLNVESLELRLVLAASHVIETSQACARSCPSGTHASLAQELVFIDAGIQNADELLTDLQSSAVHEIIPLYGDRDGVEQIAAAMRGRSGVDAIHVLAHGSDGRLWLGNSLLDAEVLAGNRKEGAVSDRSWGSIRNALSPTADVLLYGCNVASSESGTRFVDRLGDLLGADVAASDDFTGHTSLGGDWQLEHRLGLIETEVIVTAGAQRSFVGLLAPTPTVGLSVPGTAYIGETVGLTVTFSNTGGAGETGYGPYVDLVFPVNGADGAAGTATPDGLDFVSASYLGSSVSATEVVFPDDGGGVGTVDHPFAVDGTGAPLQVTGVTGDKLVALQLPFGSFAVGQPTASIDVTAQLSNLADPYDAAFPETELDVYARGGFRYGADPLDNPTSDAPIVSDPTTDSTMWVINGAVQPTLFDLAKVYSGPENETATGPNFTHSYTLQAFLATGQTANDVTFTDLLPNTLEFGGNATIVVTNGGVGTANFTILDSPVTPGAQNPADNDLILRLDDPVVGAGPSTPAATLTFDFFVPLDDANGTPVADPMSGDDHTVDNDASVSGLWSAIDIRDQPAVTVTSDATTQDHTLQQQSIAVQKSVAIGNDTGAAGATPGDELEYTIDFQISDFFAFNDVMVTDTFGDGQDWFSDHPTDTTEVMVPTLEFTEHGTTVPSAPFSATNYSVTENADGTTAVVFDVSQELIDRPGPDGDLLGGWIAPGGTGMGQPDGSFDAGPTTGRIVFRTIVLEDYKNPGGADSSVDQGDNLSNSVDIDGALLDVDDLSPHGTRETDDSGSGVTIVTGSLAKQIYAINGYQTWQPLFDPDGDGTPEVESGDLITYRVEYTLPTSDVENFQLADFLPLPVFDSTALNATRDPTSSFAPGENRWHLHPDDTFTEFFEANASSFFGATSEVEIVSDGPSNSFNVQYGTVDDPASGGRKIDILFTVPITAQPAADGLFYTNQAETIEENTFGGSTMNQVISMQDVLVNNPALNLTKGAVSTSSANGIFTPVTVGPGGVVWEVPGSSNPAFTGQIDSAGIAANPIDSDVTELDGGDLVKFAITLENTGNADAYDITVADMLPAGLQIPSGSPGLNLEIRDGDGNLLSWTGLDTGMDADLFGTGIQVHDPIQVFLADDAGDQLTRMDSRDDFDPVTNETDVGGFGAGIVDIEALARDPFGGALYAADADALGTINLSNGAFGAVGGTFGTALNGSLPGTVALTDIDGLTFHRQRGELYGVHFTGTENVLFKINTGSGSFVSGAFGGGSDDYIVVNVASRLDDIAFDRSGTLFATDATNLIRIDLDEAAATSAVATVGALGSGITDLEGLSVDEDGRLWGTTGDGGPGVTQDRLWEIDSSTGVASDPRELDNGSDYEGSESYAPGSAGSIQDLANAQTAGDGSNIIIITYDLQLTSAVTPNSTHMNSASLTNYSSQDDEVNYVQGDEMDEASASVVAPTATKSLVTTSEAHTSTNDVAIGEIVRYQIVAEIPEGTMNDFILDDNLPTGMIFLDDGTARAAFVSNGAGIVSNDIAGSLNLGLGTGPALSGNTPLTPTFVLPDDNVGSTTSTSSDPDNYLSGTDPQFKFGQIVNMDNDADNEYVVVEFNALVENILSNDDGDTLSNSLTVRSDGLNLDTSSSVGVDIVEPEIINVNKTAAPTTGDSGDTISFTVTFSNTGNTDAFDLILADTLPAEYVLQLGAVNLTPTGSISGITNTSSGNTVGFTIGQMAVAASVSLSYDAVLQVDVQPGETLQNTLALSYTSLPGASGTGGNPTGSVTPGASGDDDGERDGSGGHDDYSDADAANVTISVPTVTKTFQSSSITSATNANDEAVIGETIQYRLVATLPEGTINVAEVVDTLDAGLEFISLDNITTSAGVTTDNGLIDLNDPLTIPIGVLGQDVTFSFGNLTNSNSNAAVETITLDYTARVRNVVGNQGEGTGTMLNNSAVFGWEENGTPTTSTPDSAAAVEVIEPELEIVKMSSTGAADAGDTVTFTITVQHTAASDTEAYDVTFSDPIPTGLTWSYPADVTATHSNAGIGDITGLFQQSGQTLETIPGSSFDLLDGESVTIVVTTTVQQSVTPGTMLSNTATAMWSNIAGPDANERDGADGVGGALDDYAAENMATVTLVNNPTLTKALLGTSINNTNNASDAVVIGETVQYQLTVTLPEATLPSSQFVDDLDLGLEFISLDSVQAFSAGIPTVDITSDVDAFANTASFNPMVSGDGFVTPQTLTFDFGQLVNANNDNGATETLVLTYTVRATNTGVNTSNGAAAGQMLDNVAVFEWDNGGMSPAQSNMPSAAPVEVIEPELNIAKTVSDDTPFLGQTVTYTLQITHPAGSDADAFDLVVTDSLPAEIALSQPSLMVTGAVIDGNTSAGNNINLVLDQLALGNTITITYNATVTTDPSEIGTVLNNTAAVTWTSLDDGNTAGGGPERDGDGGFGGEDDYSDSSLESATITHPLVEVTKTLVSNVPASSGLEGNYDVTYDLRIENTGNDPLTNLSVVEDLATQYAGALVRIVPQGAAPATVQSSTADDDPEINSAFDGGASDSQLIDNTGGNTNSIAGGQQTTIRIIIEVDPNAPTANLQSGDLVNQVFAMATGADTGVVVNDLSDDPNDPTNAENDAPPDTEPDDPNRVRFPTISLDKQVFGTPTPAASGTPGNFDVFYDLTITNTGSTPLDNLQLTEDFSAHFGGAFVQLLLQAGQPATIQSSTATDDPGVSTTYDGGTTDANIFDGTSSLLDVNQSVTVRVYVEVDPDNAAATYDNVSSDGTGDLENRALVSGEDPANPGPLVTDTSDDPTDGTDTDANGDNDPDDPTGLFIPTINLTKTLVSTAAAASGTEGNYDVTYDLAITNTGNEPLSMLDLEEDISAHYAGGFVQIVQQAGQPATVQASTANDDPEINSGFDGGATDAQLFDNSGGNTNLLDTGESVTVRIIIEVDPNNPTASLTSGNFVNQANTTATGTVSSTVVMDDSDDPADTTQTDPNSDNNPDDPNLVRFPTISLDKQVVGVPTPAVSGTEGNYDVFYDLTVTNTGSTPLGSLQLTEDLTAHFGGAFVQVLDQAGQPATIQTSTATDDPGINLAFDGGASDANIFDGSSSLLNINESITIRILVEVDPDNATAIYDSVSGDSDDDLENQATASGEDPVNPGTPITDTSDDPTDTTETDPNADNDPDDATPLYLPTVSLTKTLVGTIAASSGLEGNYDITYDLAITNTGNEPLGSLSLVEDLSAHYGGAFVRIVPQGPAPATIQASTATDDPEINSAFDGGASDAQLFDISGGNTNRIEVSESVTLRIIIEVDPNSPTAILSSGNLVNQAEVTGTGTVTAAIVSDLSDDPNDGSNIDANSDNDPDDPNLVRLATISLDKQVFGTPTPAASGTPGNFDAFYDLTITNTGSTPLDNLQLTEDFAAHFGGAFVQLLLQGGQPAIIQASTATDDPGINTMYDGGTTDAMLFDGSSSLLNVNESITVRILVEVDPDNATANYDSVTSDGSGDLENRALVSSEDPANPGVPVTDTSDDPTDSTDNDADGDNDPDDPTVLNLASIDLTKTQVGPPVPAASGTAGNFDVTYDLAITNTGQEPLDMLSLTEDLVTHYGGAFVRIVPQGAAPATIQSTTASDDPEINSAFDGGAADDELFDNSGGNVNLLDTGESVTVRIIIEIDPDDPAAIYSSGDLVNQANVDATSTATGSMVSDISDDPNDPTNSDPNMDNNPDDPNRVSLPNITITKVISAGPTPAASGTAGNVDVTYTLTVTNTGSEQLTNLTLAEDLAAQLGGAFVGLTAAPGISAGAGAVAPTANGGYDGGATSANLLDGISGALDPGESYTVTLAIEVDPDDPAAIYVNGELENQATAGGTDEHTVTVTDTSDDTANPSDFDLDLDNDPDDPTGLSVPDLELTKSVGLAALASSGTPGNLDVPYQFVITNTGSQPLMNLALVEDFAAHFGGGFVSIVGTPAISASGGATAPMRNLAFDGGTTDSNLFDGASGMFAPGETVTVDVVVEIDPDNPTAITFAGTFVNQAMASGEDQNTVTASDLSDDPNDTTNAENELPADNEPDDPTVLYLASITATKVVTGSPVPASSGTQGNFDVTYDVIVTNDGPTTLQNLTMVEDFSAHFGTSFVRLVSAPTVIAGAGAVAPNLNGSYDGGSVNANVLDGVSGQLDPSETYSMQFVVEIDPDADITALVNGGFINQLTVGGTDPNMVPASDDSDDPGDSTDLDPDMDGEPDDPTFVSLPDIEAVKSVTGGPTALGATGNVQVEYTITVTNTGSEQLTNLTLVENLSAQFGGAFIGLLAAPGITPGAGAIAPTANGAYDGGTVDENVLNGTTGALDVGESYSVVLQVELDPDNPAAITNSGVFENQATVGGDGENGGMPTDVSDDPVNPVNNEGDVPADNDPDDPTGVVVRQVGLAKDQTLVTGNGDNWDVTYRLTVSNYGGVTLSNLDLAEDIATQFGAAFVAVPIDPTLNWPGGNGGTAPTLNTAWRTDTTQSVLNSDGALLPGESFTVDFTVTVDPDSTGTAQTRNNQAIVSGTDITSDPMNPVVVMDTSDSGVDPIGTNGGEPGDMGTSDDPTPLEIADIGVAKQVNGITEVAGMTGIFDVQMVVVVENTGTVDLANLQVSEDITTHYGGGFMSVQSAPMIISSNLSLGATLPTLDAAWDGTATNDTLFNGASGLLLPGDNFTVSFVIRLDTNVGDTTAPMDFTNQVVASGDGANGMSASDISDDGTNPNNDNGMGGTDDPTPALVPQLRARKNHGTVTDNGDGTFTVPVSIEVTNSGTVNLTNLTLFDDIAAAFGTAFVSVANPMVAPVGAYAGTLPTVNPAWSTTNTSVDLLDPVQTNEQLNVGETFEFSFDVTVDPDADGTSEVLFNLSQATGDGPNFDGMIVTAMDQSGNPGFNDPMGVDSDEPTPLLVPDIRAAKTQTTASKNANGTWDVSYSVVVENTGTTDLDGLDLFEDLGLQFGAVFVSVTAPMLDVTGMPNGTAPSVNGGWTTNTALNMLGNDGSLPPGESFTVTFTVTVDFDMATPAMIPLENQVTASGTFDPDPMTPGDEIDVSDNSDDGTDPNTDNGSGTTDDSTPLVVSDIEIEKQITAVGAAASGIIGNFDLTYLLTVKNSGTQPLTNLSLRDDLNLQYGSAFVGISASPVVVNVDATTTPNPNPAYNGTGAMTSGDMLDGLSGLLEVAQSFQVTVVVEVDPDAIGANLVGGELQNIASAEADSPTGRVNDLSDSPTDITNIDPDMDGDPEDPTSISLPSIVATKQMIGSPVPASSGNEDNLDVTFEFVVTNNGSETLTQLTLVEDFAAQFGGAFIGLVGVTTVTAGPGAIAPLLNAAFDGGPADANVLDGITGELDPRESYTVRIVAEVDPDHPMAVVVMGGLQNQAAAGGTDPNSVTVTDLTDDPTDPTDINPDGDNDPDDPTRFMFPEISAAKQQLGLATQVPTNLDHYRATYRVVVENTGNLTLTGLDLFEDFAAEFGTAFVDVPSNPTIVSHTFASASNLPTVNTGWVTNTTQSAFNDDGTIEPGETLTVEFVVTVDSTQVPVGGLTNQVTAMADNPITGGENTVLDLSDSGTDPQGPNPGEPGDTGTMMDPTPLYIPDATVGVAKSASVSGQVVTLAFALENFGNEAASALQLNDDLESVLSVGNFSISNVTVTTTPASPMSSLVANAIYSGSGSENILGAGSVLQPGDRGVITVEVTVTEVVDQDGSGPMALGDYLNSASTTSEDPAGNVYFDDSTDGADPDPAGNGPGDDSVPTPFTIPPNATVGVAKESIWNDISDTGVFNFYLEHFGNTAALNLAIGEDLDAIFGAGNYSITPPVLAAGSASVVPNAGFNGSSDQNLLVPGSSLSVGASAQVQFTVIVATIADPQMNGLGTYSNQVTLTGEDTDGNTFMDDSIDGTDPDPDGNNDPTNDDGSTTGSLTPDATVGVAKTAAVALDQTEVTFDFFIEHFGNTQATSISIVEDFDTLFGAGNYAVNSIRRISGPSTFVANGMFDGGSDQELVGSLSSMLPGDTAELQLVVGVMNVFGDFFNQVTALTTDGDGNMYVDLSDSGTDPDPTGDGDPTGGSEDDPTPFMIIPGSISGVVYVDLNNNGVQDPGELPIPDIEIQLNGTTLAGTVITQSALTDVNGNYLFEGLPPGTYILTQVHHVAFFDGLDTLGNLGGDDSVNDQLTVTLTAASFTAQGYNFGERGLDPLYTGKDPFLASSGGTTLVPPLGDNETEVEGSTIEQVGDRLTITGTSANDRITVALGTISHTIVVDFIQSTFAAGAVRFVEVIGDAGFDTLTIVGTDDNDTATLFGGGIVVNGVGYEASASGVESLTFLGGQGYDRVTLYGTHGDDRLQSNVETVQLINADGRMQSAGDVEKLTVFGRGGFDRATMVGSERGDRLTSNTDRSTLRTPYGRQIAVGFEFVTVRGEDGGDVASLRGAIGGNRFIATPGRSTLTTAEAEYRAFDFETVSGIAFGSNNQALLYDSDSDDILSASPNNVMLTGSGFQHRARDFETVKSFSTAGLDRAVFHDSAGDDDFISRPDIARMLGNGYDNRAYNFELVVATATTGDDMALLYDTAGDDHFVSRADQAVLRRLDMGYRSLVRGFDSVRGFSSAGNDTARFMSVRDNELLYGREDRARVMYGHRDHRATSFDRVNAHAHDNEQASADLRNVDYLFSLFGSW